MKKILFFCIFSPLLIFFTASAFAKDYNYVSKKDFKSWIETGKDILICDIQTPESFDKHHFKNALETNAYPAKKEKQLTRLKPVIKKYEESEKPVVIICPRGGGGAKRTYDYLEKNNIPQEKLIILEGGAEGWPYDELVIKE